MNDNSAIPKCRKISFDTGNILTWSRLRNKLLISGTDEVLESTNSLVKCWLTRQDTSALQLAEELHVCCPIHGNKAEILRSPLSKEERAELRINLKVMVWPGGYVRGSIKTAVAEALASLSASDCDSVVLSVAGTNSWAKPLSLPLEDVKPLWLELEELHTADIVASLGAADFAPDLLESLHAWAAVKPQICQLHTQVACTTPLRLRNFASEKGLQLLTHSDSPEPLPADRLRRTMSEAFGCEADGSGWLPRWVVRLSTTYRDRGVVKTWGYVYRVERSGQEGDA